MDDERFDFYEITFSLDEGDGHETALAIFETVEKLAGVQGACFSGGNYGPHPFTRASVEKAARTLAEMWPADFDPAERGTFNTHALHVVDAVLTAACNPSAAALERSADA